MPYFHICVEYVHVTCLFAYTEIHLHMFIWYTFIHDMFTLCNEYFHITCLHTYTGHNYSWHVYMCKQKLGLCGASSETSMETELQLDNYDTEQGVFQDWVRSCMFKPLKRSLKWVYYWKVLNKLGSSKQGQRLYLKKNNEMDTGYILACRRCLIKMSLSCIEFVMERDLKFSKHWSWKGLKLDHPEVAYMWWWSTLAWGWLRHPLVRQHRQCKIVQVNCCVCWLFQFIYCSHMNVFVNKILLPWVFRYELCSLNYVISNPEFFMNNTSAW